jgi:hypothetical protein
MNFKSFGNLRRHLASKMMFTDAELREIMRCCGRATVGNAVIACEILGIELIGSDVDLMYNCK